MKVIWKVIGKVYIQILYILLIKKNIKIIELN